MPVVRDLIARAATHPEAPVLGTPQRRVTAAELERSCRAGAAQLRALGVRRGDVVAIDLSDPVDTITAVLAADVVGALPLLCDARWSDEQRTVVVGGLSPRLHLRTPLGPQTLTSEPTGSEGLPVQLADASGDDLAWAGFTSGSTGRPRAVVRRRASWAGSFDAFSDLIGLRAADVVLLPGSPASSLSAFATMHALAAGASAVVLDLGAPTAALLLARALAEADIVHAVPTVLARVVELVEAGAPTPLRTLVSGGAAVPDGLRARAAALGMTLVTYYGAAELSFVAVDVDGRGLRPFPQVDLDLRPVAGTGLAQVWVRSPWLADGYLAGADGPMRIDEHGWATVGDLATRIDDGERLVLRGRADGAVLTGGSTVVPEDVEAVLRSVPGVRDVVVVGTAHAGLGAVVTAVVEPDGGLSRAALSTAARAGLSGPQCPRRWVPVRSLPRTPSGKPARAAISAALDAGTLEITTW